MDCEIILMTENIDVCRYFYREVVGLGEPELDSCQQVVFRLNEKSVLVLEKSELPCMEHSNCSIRFALEIKDLPAMEQRMKEYGLAMSDGFGRLGRAVRRGIDPEGNIFQVFAASN